MFAPPTHTHTTPHTPHHTHTPTPTPHHTPTPTPTPHHTHTHTGSDYAAISDLAVTFAPDETVKMVSVTIINDEVLEGEESFSGQLSLPSGSTGVVIGQRESTATIEDEDGELRLLTS